MCDLHFVLRLICDHELTVYTPHKTFKERALDSGHLEISPQVLLSGVQAGLCSWLAEISVQGGWGSSTKALRLENHVLSLYLELLI